MQIAASCEGAYISAMSSMVDEGFAEVWEWTIKPDQADLTPEAARYFLKLKFAEADRARMNELAAKARLGALLPEEQTELGNYMQLGWFIDLMKSKARLSLGTSGENSEDGCRS